MRGNKQGKEGGVTISGLRQRGENEAVEIRGCRGIYACGNESLPLANEPAARSGGRRRRRVGSSCLVFNVDVREERQ